MTKLHIGLAKAIATVCHIPKLILIFKHKVKLKVEKIMKGCTLFLLSLILMNCGSSSDESPPRSNRIPH